jgi:hypothetical protein
MKEKNSIDQWLKQSFEQDAPGNPEALWKSIAPSLPTKSNKRVLAWWLGAAILTLALGIVLLLNTKTNNSIADSSKTTHLNISKHSNSDKTKSSENNGLNKATDQKTIENKTKVQEKTAITASNSKNSLKPSPDKSFTSKSKLHTPNAEKSVSKRNKLGAEKENTNSATTKNTNNIFLVMNSVPRKPVANHLSLSENTIGFPILVPEYTYTKPHKNNHLSSPSSWTFGFNAGLNPSFVNSVIQDGLKPYVHQNFLKRKNEGETSLFTGGFELYARKHFGSFFIESGIARYQMGYNQNYNYNIDLIPITSALFGNQPDANGRYPLDDQTPYLIDPTPESISYSNKVSIGVTEIPLRLGYQFETGRWLFSPSIGAAMGFSGTVNAKTIDYQTLKLIDYNEFFHCPSCPIFEHHFGWRTRSPTSSKQQLYS